VLRGKGNDSLIREWKVNVFDFQFFFKLFYDSLLNPLFSDFHALPLLLHFHLFQSKLLSLSIPPSLLSHPIVKTCSYATLSDCWMLRLLQVAFCWSIFECGHALKSIIHAPLFWFSHLYQRSAGICQWNRVPGVRQPVWEDGWKQLDMSWPGKTVLNLPHTPPHTRHLFLLKRYRNSEIDF